jgi:hypothetical protein
LDHTRVAVISGAAFWQFKKELLEPLRASERQLANLFILTTSGAELWVHKSEWQRNYVDRISSKNKKKIFKALTDVLGVDEKRLEPLVDDRDSGMTYSALGKDASPDLKNPWDPDQQKRKTIVDKLAPLLPGLELKIGGTTSIDITNLGINKSYGVRKILEFLKLRPDQSVFVGDAVFVGGNDEPVKSTGVRVLETLGPDNTRAIIKEILKQPQSIDASEISFEKPPVAYFCAEYALDDNSLRYAGGLGVLAADYLYEARDQKMPLICVGLWYANQNIEKYPLIVIDGKPLILEIPFEKTTIIARARGRQFSDNLWLVLLETDVAEIHASPYSLEDYTWIRQDLVLGMGGAKILKALNIDPKIYHLNEGHTGFAAFELLTSAAALKSDKSITNALKLITKKVVATKHTILKAGIKIYEIDFMRYFEPYCDNIGVSAKELFVLGTTETERAFSATQLLLKIAHKHTAVSTLHAKFEKELHPKSQLFPITNGVYADRWRAPEWGGGESNLSDGDLWKIKSDLRRDLIDFANKKGASDLDPNTCTVVWARRFVSYKRPGMLISDLLRLEKLIRSQTPLQFVISGNVYLNETAAQKVLDRILSLSRDPKWRDRISYIPDYSISVAHRLVSGADLWLNTPFRGKEACGTSGMKACLNGSLQMSISDGWIEEVDWKGIGWVLPDENTEKAMYEFFEKEVAPAFYNRKNGLPLSWISRMRKTISIVEKNFTTERMLREYIKKLY